jgi:biotin carboxyl carrier protein
MNTYKYKVKGVDYEVEIAEVEGNIAKVNVNGIPFEIELQKPINAAKHPSMNKPKVVAPTNLPPKGVASTAGAPQQQAAPVGGRPVGASGNAIKAPLPGTITELKVQVGQQVNVGDTVLVLEAMKMQNNIESDYAGQVTSVLVKPGDTVMEGAVLLTIG